MDLVEQAMKSAHEHAARVVPVFARHVLLTGSVLGGLVGLPRDGRPIASRRDRDSALAGVAFEVAELARTMAAGADPQRASPTRERIPLKKIFNTFAIPTYSRVDPQELGEIREHLAQMREGLVVDGPSGIGKSTAVQIALDGLDGARVKRIVGSGPHPERDLQDLIDNGFPEAGGYLVIDDFHLLQVPLQQRVAHLVKYVASEGPEDAKVVLIGVNPVGDTLVRHLPDLAGRLHRIRMGPQPAPLVRQLIRNGEHAANIRFRHADELVEAAAGSFYIAQLLCYEAAYREGARETEAVTKVIESGPDGYVTDRVFQRRREIQIPHFAVDIRGLRR
ncbi:MAG: hypothetical protein R3B70_13500 [Polyangiaceae bacterium]